jgi:intergrase/recombinase
MSNLKGMRPAGKELTALYKLVSDPYSERVKDTFKWQTGEKQKALRAFIEFCEYQGIRDRNYLEEMMAEFGKYCASRVPAWMGWEKSDRNNYLGFLFRESAMKMHCAKKDSEQATDTAIAGTGQAEEWSF